MGIRINGTVLPIRGKKTWSYDPINGLQVVVPWESAGDSLVGIANQCIRDHIGFTYESNPVHSRLVLRASGGQAGIPNLAVDEWQVTGNEIQKSLFEHPEFSGIDEDTIDKINDGLRDNTHSDAIGLTGNPLILYNFLKRGQTHYALGQYVIRHSTNVSNNSTFSVSDANVERIYSFGQLNNELTNPNLWVYPFPLRLQTKIANIPAPPFTPAGYLWGWRKLPSTEHTAAGNRIAITTEYWLEQWPLILYPRSTSPGD